MQGDVQKREICKYLLSVVVLSWNEVKSRVDDCMYSRSRGSLSSGANTIKCSMIQFQLWNRRVIVYDHSDPFNSRFNFLFCFGKANGPQFRSHLKCEECVLVGHLTTFTFYEVVYSSASRSSDHSQRERRSYQTSAFQQRAAPSPVLSLCATQAVFKLGCSRSIFNDFFTIGFFFESLKVLESLRIYWLIKLVNVF